MGNKSSNVKKVVRTCVIMFAVLSFLGFGISFGISFAASSGWIKDPPVLDVLQVGLLYTLIVSGFVFAVQMHAVLFFRDRAVKLAIADAVKSGLRVVDRESWRRITAGIGRATLQQYFVERLPNGIEYTRVSRRHRQNYFIHANGVLLYIMTSVGTAYPDALSKYSVVDPYGGDVAEIRVDGQTTMKINWEWAVFLFNGRCFDLTVDSVNFSSRKDGCFVVSGIPARFATPLFDLSHHVDLSCDVVDSQTGEPMLLARSDRFGYADLLFPAGRMQLELAVLYMLRVLIKYEDGLNQTFVM